MIRPQLFFPVIWPEDFSEKKIPVGKGIIAKVNDEEHHFVVTGIFENIPKNSSLRAQCFVNSKWSIETANKYHEGGNADKDWGLDSWTTWVLLSKGCNPASLEQQFRNLEIKYIRKVPDKHYSLQNLCDVYLRSNDVLYSEIYGSINNIRMFSIIAFLIILVATINYIILSTAVSTGRAKEIGIRKTIGAGTNSLRNQLLYESILLAVFVLPFALVMEKKTVFPFFPYSPSIGHILFICVRPAHHSFAISVCIKDISGLLHE
jgi:putative ABC transport system permease protein